MPLRFLVSLPELALRLIRFVNRWVAIGSNLLFDRVIAIVNTSRTLDSRIAIPAAAVVFSIYLFPTIAAGLTGDDAHRPYLAAFGHATGLSFWQTYLAETRDMGNRRPGFFPFEAVPSLIWFVFPSVTAMRTLQLLAIVLNAATFGALVALISRSGGLSLLAIACTALAMQLRIGADAVLGPLLVQQLIVELALLALVSLVWYERRGSFVAIACAVSSAILAALIHPIGYIVSLVLAVLLATNRSRLTQYRTIAFAVVLIPIVCLAIGIEFGAYKSQLEVFASLGEAQATAKSYASSVSKELFAAIPASYRAAGNIVGESVKASTADYRFLKVPDPGRIGWLSVAVISSSFFIGNVTSNQASGSIKALWMVGALLWILPALLPASESMRIGMGDAGAYVQSYGVGTLLALSLAMSRKMMRRETHCTVFVASVTLVALLVAYGNVRANAYVIARSRLADAGREVLAPAAAAGLFDQLPAGSTIVPRGFDEFGTGGVGIRDFRFAAYGVTKRLFRTEPQTGVLQNAVACRRMQSGCVLGAHEYLLSAAILPNTGVFLNISHLTGSNNNTLFSDGGSRFARLKSASARSQMVEREGQITGHGVTLNTQMVGESDLLTRAKRLCGPVEFKRTFDAVLPHILWGKGFYPAYPAIPFIAANALPARRLAPAQNPWAYAGRSARLVIVNDVCVRTALEFTAHVYTSVPARLDVGELGNHRAYATNQDGVVVTFHVPSKVERTEVSIETDAPAAHDIYYSARYPDARQYDIHMLVDAPSLSQSETL